MGGYDVLLIALRRQLLAKKMREPDAVDSHLFAHVFWAEHLSWAPTTFYFAPSQNIFTRGEFLAYEWATLIYLQESASNFLLFYEHHSPSTFLFHLVSQILSSRLVTVFAFQTRGWFLPILSAENQTKLWTDQMELPWKKFFCQEYDFSGRSRRTTRCRPRVFSLVWLVTDSTHAHSRLPRVVNPIEKEEGEKKIENMGRVDSETKAAYC